MSDLAPGSVLGGYRIERWLGRGGMGEVWLAHDERLDRPVALKLVSSSLAEDPERRLRFLAETRLAASLDHPHIVPIYASGEADGRLYLAMRYVQGADLEVLLSGGGPMEPRRATTLLRGIADALDAAHARGLVHRDVKPSNILVTTTSSGEHGYLTDFGLARQLAAGTTLDGGQIAGSLGYVAPELIEGSPVDARADVYSLACTLYAALGGVSPFERESEQASILAHLAGTVRPLAEVSESLAPLDPLIAGALAREPADRPASAGELIRAAAEALGEPGGAWTVTGGRADIELPYVGLRPFEEADARFYVGREADVDALVEHLRSGRFLAVFGPSGSGKSSLVRAGLVPALRAGRIPGSDGWPIAIVRPGALPLETFAARQATLSPGASMAATVDSLAGDVRTLHHATELALADAPPTARLVWVVDQAEELFTLATDEAARRAVIENLVHAATVPGGRTLVVLAMRADFYHRCAAYPGLAALVAATQYLVSPLSTDALRRTIVEPARLVGLAFEPGLVETILEDVAQRPGALPLLEHLLFELWARRRGATLTLAGYRECGGIEGAIAVRAEATYTGLAADDEIIARRIFLRLVQPGEGTEDTRRRATLDELGAATATDAQRLIDVLADARLITVTASETGPEPVVDIAHEALLRAWPRLRAWIDADREALRTARRIANATAEWERLGREPEALLHGARLAEAVEFVDEHRDLLAAPEFAYVERSIAERDRQVHARTRAQRLRFGIAAALATFFLAVSAVSVSLWFQSQASERDAVSARDEAETQAAAAEARRVEALGRQLVAQSLASRADMPSALLLALEGLDRYESEEAWANLAELLQYTPQTVARYGWEELRVPVASSPSLADLAVSQDGSALAAVLSGCTDDLCETVVAELWVWDTATWAPAHGPIPADVSEATVDEFGQSTRLAFAPAGDRLIFPSPAGLAVLDLDDESVTLVEADPSGVPGSVAWDAEAGVVRWIERREPDPPRVWTWDPATEAATVVDLLPSLEPPRDFGQKTALLSRTGRWAATVLQGFDPDGSERFQSEVFDTSGASLGVLTTDLVAFSSTNDLLVARDGATLSVLSLPDLRPVGAAIPKAATGADTTADGRQLIVWEAGRTVAAVDIATGAATIADRPSAEFLQGHAVVGARMYVGIGSGLEVLELDRDSGLSEAVGDLPEGAVGANVVASGDGRRIASWGNSPFEPARTVTVLDVQSGDRTEIRPDDPAGIRMARLDEDGSTLLTLHDSGRLISTPVAGGPASTLATFRAWPSDAVPGSFLVSPDGMAAVVQPLETQILGPSGEIVVVPVGSDTSAALAADGRSVVIPSCEHRRVRVVSLADGTVTSDRSVDACLWLNDIDRAGTRAISVGTDPVGLRSQLELFDPESWQRRGVLVTGDEAIVAAWFGAGTADGTLTTLGTTVRRWEIAPETWRARACRIAGRNLHPEEWSRYLGDEPYRPTCPALPAPEPAQNPAPTSSAPPPPTALPTATNPGSSPGLCEGHPICYLAVAGRYSGGSFSPAIAFDLGEGWYQGRAGEAVIPLVWGDGQYFSIIRGVTTVFDDEGNESTIEPTPEAMVAWLRQRETMTLDAVRPATLAGLAATEIDLTSLAFSTMFQVPGGTSWLADGGARWRIRIAALDPETTLMVLAESPADRFDEFWAELAEPIVDSLVLE